MPDPKVAEKFLEFVSVIAQLRNPDGGCPWDLAQTNLSIRPYLVEECYEVLEAIDSEDDNELRKELGDLLLQVALHSQIASDRKAFDIGDVISGITQKMILRHPHVFGEGHAETPEDVKRNWERIKLEEKRKAGEVTTILSGVPTALPALVRAERLGQKASKFNFDWENVDGVWAKVEEELAELKAEVASSPDPERQKRISHEIGDLLFALAQLGRWLGAHTEDALRESCNRFTERFTLVEKSAEKSLAEYSVQELEVLWQQAKAIINNR